MNSDRLVCVGALPEDTDSCSLDERQTTVVFEDEQTFMLYKEKYDAMSGFALVISLFLWSIDHWTNMAQSFVHISVVLEDISILFFAVLTRCNNRKLVVTGIFFSVLFLY